MKTSNLILLLFCASLFFNSCIQPTNITDRETLFNDNWKFIRADVAGAEQANFDDSAWRTLDLPHDYSIEDLPEKSGINQISPFSEESQGKRSTGHVMGGTAWYRKHFTFENEDEGKQIQVLFDGVYMNADVWINGQHLGNHPYGYTTFAYNLTEYLNPAGDENVLAVQVKNEGQNSRWYSGSGIYRNVKMLKTNPVHIALWGNYITTPEVSEEKANVKIETSVANETGENQEITVKTEIINPAGEVVATSENPLGIRGKKSNTQFASLEIENPELWSPEAPNLYAANIQVVKNGKLLDETTQKFGIRSIEFSPEKGFLLNGKNVLLKGGCVHHDNGILGAAAFETAEYRRVKLMKDNGFNAIRTAHNPPSELFLNACDEIGMLVINESFDQWQIAKNPQDYNLYFDDWWERDMESMLLRDRNHPSIIIWSVGNEIKERADSSGVEILKNLKAKVKEFDTNRPVTQAVCSLWEFKNRPWEDNDAAFEHLDVHGYNYSYGQYEMDFEDFPNRIMIGTESFPIEAFENWQMVEKHSYVIGDFVWTGMDYFGESAIGNAEMSEKGGNVYPDWPWFNANCGDISILGYKKPQMYYRDVIWRNSDLEMLVHEPVAKGNEKFISRWGWPKEWKSWTWESNEGTPLQVAVYSRCDEVLLQLNGEEIGRKKVSEETELKAYFEVEYQPGELVAIAFKDGKEVARQTLQTAGKPSQIKLTAESETVPANANHLAYFNVEVLDENGVLVPNAEIPIEFSIAGNGKLQAVGNGNPTDMKSFQQAKVNTFGGRCQLIVRSSNEGGEIGVSAKAEGLKTGEAKVVLQ